MPPKSTKPMFLYLATNDDGVLKIGLSNNPYRRDLKIDNHALIKRQQTVRFLRVTKADRETERQVHARFRQFCVAGREWYRYAPEIVQFFDALPDDREAAERSKMELLNKLLEARHKRRERDDQENDGRRRGQGAPIQAEDVRRGPHRDLQLRPVQQMPDADLPAIAEEKTEGDQQIAIDNYADVNYYEYMMRNRKPSFSELIDSLVVLCRAETAGAMFCEWIGLAVGSYEDAQTYLSQVIARTTNPVVAMLAKQAISAR